MALRISGMIKSQSSGKHAKKYIDFLLPDDAIVLDNVQHSKSITLRGESPEVIPIILTENTEIVVGRSPNANVVLNNSYISGQHVALLNSNGNIIVVKDLNSTNGTYIDGQRLEPQMPFTLRTGQRLILGSEDIVYTI